MFKTATLGIIIALTIFYRVSYTLEEDHLKHSLSLIYQSLTKNFWPYFNLDYKDLLKGCQRLDLNSYFHPDTIFDDKYLFNYELEYEDKKNLINRYGFTYDRLQAQVKNKEYGGISNFQGVQMSVWSYENWFKSQTCLFEKKMRIPSILEASEKSVMNHKQNNRISELKARGASEECLKSVQVARIGYSLEKEAECRRAMEILINQEYKSPDIPIKYIIKSDNHEGSGIYPLDEVQAQDILYQYDNGNLCGKTNNPPLQLQEFVHNPLLIDVQDIQGHTQKHMFVFRVYFIIASTQPLIIYIYDKSSVYIALQPFQSEQFSKYSHFCHNNVIKQYLAEMGIHGYAAQQIIEQRDLMISYEDLVDKLIKSGSLPPNTDGKSFFFNKIQEKMSMFYTEIAEFFVDSRFAQNSAMDFIMDSDLNIYILELNNSYNLVERYDVRRTFLRELQYQNIELMLGFMRERYKRIKKLLDDKMIPYLKKNGMIRKLTNELESELQQSLMDEPLYNKPRVGDYLLLNISEGVKKCK